MNLKYFFLLYEIIIRLNHSFKYLSLYRKERKNGKGNLVLITRFHELGPAEKGGAENN